MRAGRGRMPLRKTSIVALAVLSLGSAAHAAPAHRHVHKTAAPSAPEPVHQISADGVLNSDDLMALAKMGVERFPKDQFAVPAANAYLKREFSLSIPLTQYGMARYKYDQAEQTLTITFAAAGFGGDEIKLASKTKNLGSYVGQNAFGARATVDSFHDDDLGLNLIALPAHEPSAIYYEASVSAAPDEARQIAAHAEVLIEGAVIAKDNAAAACEDRFSAATLDDPASLSIHSCVVNAAATKIVILNAATGTVYGQWLADPAHPYETDSERRNRESRERTAQMQKETDDILKKYGGKPRP